VLAAACPRRRSHLRKKEISTGDGKIRETLHGAVKKTGEVTKSSLMHNKEMEGDIYVPRCYKDVNVCLWTTALEDFRMRIALM
jgi:hypothetical protein